MPTLNLNAKPNAHQQTLADLSEAFKGSTDTQFRMSGTELSTKNASDRESGSLRAVMSGQKEKFEKAATALEKAYCNTTGLAEVPPEVKTAIANGVKGKGANNTELLKTLQDAAIKQCLEEYPKQINVQGVKGPDLFRRIEALPISPEAKQQIHCEVGRTIMKGECEKAGGQPTLLRSNTEGTSYMTAFMKKNASDYTQAVIDQAKTGIRGLKLPEGPIPKAGDPGVRTDDGFKDMSPDDLAKWNKTYVDSTNILDNAIQENVDRLTPQAKEFLGTCADQARQSSQVGQQDYSANITLVSTLALRSVNPSIMDDYAPNSNNPDAKDSKILFNSSVVAQTFYNNINQPPGNKLGDDKPQNKVVNLMRNEDNVARLKKFASDLEQSAPLKPSLVLNVPKQGEEMPPEGNVKKLGKALEGQIQFGQKGLSPGGSGTALRRK